MKQLLPLICLLLATCMESVEAQQHIDLSGKWHFGTGAKATYDGFVSLPGSMQTNGKGEKVTALVGVLNVHWGEKGYAMASEWSEFCSPLVPLAKFPKFVFSAGETLSVPVDVYNAQHDTTACITYRITDNADGSVTAHDTLAHSPSKMTLSVSVNGQGQNHWDFWVYPDIQEEQATQGLHIADTLDAKALEVLRNVGKVLVTAAGKVTLGNDVKQHYLPVFWNTSWFKMRPPHTTGAYIGSVVKF